MIPIVTFIPALNKLSLIITHNIQPLWVAVIIIFGANVENWIHDVVCVVCGSGSFVPVASNLEPAQVQRQEVVTIRNIGPNRTGDMKN